MKRLVTAAVLGASLAGAANAADIAPAGHDWSGVYVGGTVGYGWATGVGNASSCESIRNVLISDESNGVDLPYSDLCAVADDPAGWASVVDGWMYTWYANEAEDYIEWNDGDFSDDNSSEGWNYGVQVGFNHQAADNVVLGVEADLRKFSGDGTSSSTQFEFWNHVFGGDVFQKYGDGFVDSTSELDWMTTFRARAGLTFGAEDRMLAYGTGGLALAIVNTTMDAEFDEDAGCSCGFDTPSGDDTLLQAGFVVGGGLEFALTDTVSVGAEYLYTKFYGQQDRTVRFDGDDGEGHFDVVHEVGLDDMHTINAKVNFNF